MIIGMVGCNCEVVMAGVAADHGNNCELRPAAAAGHLQLLVLMQFSFTPEANIIVLC